MAAKLLINFTHKWLDSITSAENRDVWHDSGCKNLTVRFGTGKEVTKTFYWYGRIGGQPTRMKLGRYPQMSVPAARDEAARISGVAASGEFPKARATAFRDEMTLGQLFNWYLDFHAKPHKRTWEEDQRNYEKRLIQWSGKKLSQITKQMVKQLHVEIGEKKPDEDLTGGTYAANKMLELLGFMYRLAIREIDIKASDPTEGIKRFPRTERDRFLNQDELPKFLAALKLHPRETTRDLIMLALLTGARRDNVCSMRWADIDFKHRVWRVDQADSKSKEPMRIILPEAAIEILKRRKQSSTSKWVLPGKSPRGHTTDPKCAMRSIIKRAGIAHVRFHDLRRTLGSWQAAQGTSMIVIGKSLGHTSPSATKVYARLDLDPVRESVERATASMMAVEKNSEK